MVVSAALNNALSSLLAVQSQINTVSNNISNANTAGYTEKTVQLTNLVGGDGSGDGVGVQSVERQVDMLLNQDIYKENGTLGATNITDQYFKSIQNLIGSTTAGGVLNTSIDNLSQALSALATTPSDASQQQNVVAAAANAAQTLSSVEDSVQGMRSQADSQIATDVQTVNGNLQQINTLNQQIQRASALGQPVGDLEDQRDQAVLNVSQYVGIQTFTRGDGSLAVYTQSGQALVDGTVNKLSYNPASSVSSSTPSGAITVGPSNIDITNKLGSGEIGGLLTMRNQTLPQLSKQLNVLAQGLYQQTYAPPPLPTNSIQAAGNLSSGATVGSKVMLSYTGDSALHDSNGNAYDATFMLTNTGPNQWSMSLQSLISEADGSSPTVTTSGGSGLPMVLGTYDGSTGTFTSATDPSAPPSGTLELPEMTLQDGSAPATLLGEAGPPPVPPTFSFDDSQMSNTRAASSLQPVDNGAYRLFTGVNVVDPTSDNAATITVNPLLDPNQGGDPGLLFVAGDGNPSVSQRMSDGLAASIDPSKPPYAAIGANLPAGKGSLEQYANVLLATNATQASDADNGNQFQSQYVSTLQQQASSLSGVNMDEELAKLTELQNTYQASATVMTTVNQMLDSLFAAISTSG